MMDRRILPLLFWLSMTTLLAAQEKPIVEFYTTTVSGNPGDTVCLPIKVKNFRDVLGVGLGLQWNAEALQFVEVKTEGYSITGNQSSNYGLTNVQNGDIKWSWLSGDFPTATTVEDDATLFELCFILDANSAGGFYSLSFDSDFISPEVILDENLYDDPLAVANFIPGGVFIQDPNSTLELTIDFQFYLDCGFYGAFCASSVQGGQAPYTYNWTGPQSIFSTASRIATPREGIYHLTVKDQTGAEVTAEILVDFMGNEDGLEKPVVDAKLTHPDCGVSNGRIDLNETSPLPDHYRYSWSTGATTPDLDSISGGSYTLVVYSTEFSCTDTLTYELISKGNIDLDTVQTPLNCSTNAATIGVQDTIGATFYYSWNTGDTTNSINVSQAGNYNLTITDGSCAQEISFEVTDDRMAPNRNNFIIIDDNIACDDTTATIGVTYFGLRPDIQYQWSTGATTSKIEVTEIGTYTLDVFGEDSCTTTFSFTVLQEDPDLPINQTIKFLGCQAEKTLLSMIPQDGRIYSFIWNTAETTSAISVDQPGTYTVTVTESFSGCSQVFVFDEESIGDPTTGAISVNVDCGIQADCYNGTTVDISIEGAAEPVQYTWSDGTSISANGTTQLNIYSQQNLDLYIEDADGCRDTLKYLLEDCQLDRTNVNIKGRQYIFCENDPETGETVSYLYNEVLNSAGMPPYIFYWGNGFVDTSYFRSRQPLDSLPNLFISIVDQLGNRFDRQLSEAPAFYACGDDATPVFGANDTIVAPGTSFTYPIYIENHLGVERVVYTIDWDPCLVTVDSISFYNNDGFFRTEYLDDNSRGTYEAFYGQDGGSPSNDRLIVGEVHCRANAKVEGVSPFLFSINEVPRKSDGSTTLLRPQHGSIVVSAGEDIVLPGDANLNGIVNHQDLLNIGLAYLGQGPDRREQQTSRPDYGYPWLQKTPLSLIDYRNIDCNGDGVIDASDLTAIEENFSYVPSSGRGQTVDGEIPLYFDIDTLYNGQSQTFPVILGDDALNAIGVYGLAFSLQYDSDIIDSESIQVDFSNSWLTTGTTPLTYYKVDSDNQMIHIAISRTDGINVVGSGAIATVSLTANAEDSTLTNFQIVDAQIIAADETNIPALIGSVSAVVQTVTGTHHFQALSQQVRVFPNPVKDRLFIDAQDLQLRTYKLFDAQGKLINSGRVNRPVLEMAGLQEGVYLLQIFTEQGVVRKLIVR